MHLKHLNLAGGIILDFMLNRPICLKGVTKPKV